MNRTLLLSLLMALLLSSCSTVTMRDQGINRLSTEPDYVSTKDFYFWGLSGEYTIDVQKVCKESKPEQIQSTFTPLDVFLGVVTIGIYHPRTVKIWCKTKA